MPMSIQTASKSLASPKLHRCQCATLPTPLNALIPLSKSLTLPAIDEQIVKDEQRPLTSPSVAVFLDDFPLRRQFLDRPKRPPRF
jgi:hypothetical protein